METITYYADNGSMGDTSDADCDKFREWAESELRREFPEYDIKVSEEQSTQTVLTSDYENECWIIEFCSSLWDRCPWDWV